MNPIDIFLPGIRVPLGEWNRQRMEAFNLKLRKVQHPEEFPNGLSCECGGDLYDTQQFIPGHPGKLVVKCMECKFKGARYE